MSDYREEVNKYKSKRLGQTDAKVVAPKGRKKKVDKPWCVVVFTSWGNEGNSEWKPWRNLFAKEHDARAYLRKQTQYKWTTCYLEFNGEKVE
jgi:hypothetical protein